MNSKTKSIGKKALGCMLTGIMCASVVAAAPSWRMASADESTANGKDRYVSQYDSLEEMYDAEAELNLEIAKEGMVLLKNKDKALPLSRGDGVTLLGERSYNIYPGRSGVPGNRAPAVTLPESLESAGLKVNGRVQGMYENNGEGTLMTEVTSG